MITTNYILTFGEIRAKSYRYSKALAFNVLLLMFRPVTLQLCLTFGADRRLEFNRYSLLRLLAILNQCIHCAWLAFRYHFRICTPHSIRLFDYALPSLFTDDVKRVADMFCPDLYPRTKITILIIKINIDLH